MALTCRVRVALLHAKVRNTVPRTKKRKTGYDDRQDNFSFTPPAFDTDRWLGRRRLYGSCIYNDVDGACFGWGLCTFLQQPGKRTEQPQRTK